MIRKYADIFCWKNVSSFCSAKATHIFSTKNIRILCIEYAKTVNEMTLNELVKLTTLWTTGPWWHGQPILAVLASEVNLYSEGEWCARKHSGTPKNKRICETEGCSPKMRSSGIYCTKTTQVFFGHVFFSVTETDVTIKIYKEYSKMDWKRMKQMKQTNSSSHWWSVSFVSFVTKQDETVQTPWSVLVTKQGVT